MPAGALFFSLCVSAFSSLTVVDLFMNERHLVMREVTTGYYQAFPYLLAKCETFVAAPRVCSKCFKVVSLHLPSLFYPQYLQNAHAVLQVSVMQCFFELSPLSCLQSLSTQWSSRCPALPCLSPV